MLPYINRGRTIFALSLLCFITSGGSVFARDFRITSQRMWLELPTTYKDDLIIFRKFALVASTGLTRNVLSVVCNKKRGVYPHLVLAMPPEVALSSFRRDDWKTDVAIRVLLNEQKAFTVTAEYIKGEFFIDRTGDYEDVFDRMLVADKLGIELGHRKDRIVYSFDEVMDLMLDDVFMRTQVEQRHGKIIKLTAAQVLQRCRAFAAEGSP